MKIRKIIVMVQSFGNFDRIDSLKLCPKVILRDILKTLNLFYRDETYVLSNGHEPCQNYYDLIVRKHMYIYTL